MSTPWSIWAVWLSDKRDEGLTDWGAVEDVGVDAAKTLLDVPAKANAAKLAESFIHRRLEIG